MSNELVVGVPVVVHIGRVSLAARMKEIGRECVAVLDGKNAIRFIESDIRRIRKDPDYFFELFVEMVEWEKL